MSSSSSMRVARLLLAGASCRPPLTASAQSAIAGQVPDPSGAVLAGVTVEASSPSLIEFSRVFKCWTAHVEPRLGIFNALNAATILSQNNSFGPSLNQVQQVLDGRVVRLGIQFDL